MNKRYFIRIAFKPENKIIVSIFSAWMDIAMDTNFFLISWAVWPKFRSLKLTWRTILICIACRSIFLEKQIYRKCLTTNSNIFHNKSIFRWCFFMEQRSQTGIFIFWYWNVAVINSAWVYPRNTGKFDLILIWDESNENMKWKVNEI